MGSHYYWVWSFLLEWRNVELDRDGYTVVNMLAYSPVSILWNGEFHDLGALTQPTNNKNIGLN